jgi:hypothetical protein
MLVEIVFPEADTLQHLPANIKNKNKKYLRFWM